MFLHLFHGSLANEPFTACVIEKYIFNELDSGFPEPVVPEQNIDLWINAILELLEDNNKYMKLCQLSQSRANAFISKIGINNFVDFLRKSYMTLKL